MVSPMAFTPISALVGGALIGLSASILLAFDGRVAGISGIVGRLFRGDPIERGWRLAFVGGLAAGALGVAAVAPASITPTLTQPIALTVVAGLLVGVGTQLGNGCTSGHGVCGMSRLSKRSIVATMTFMAVAMFSTFLVQHVLLRGAS